MHPIHRSSNHSESGRENGKGERTMRNRIVWVDSATEENDYICPNCHGRVSMRCLTPKTENPTYGFICESCYDGFDIGELHLEIEKNTK